jgi:glycosyltransferase involved in cell wall biosynthesis
MRFASRRATPEPSLGQPTAPEPRPPLLSVVTPSYNMGRFLPQAMRSVAALSFPHEHVVVDGGSTDGTLELLRAAHDPSVVWLSEPDRGQTHAVNKALEMARGDLIGWLNADDEYVVENVERAVEELEANPDLDAVFGLLEIIDRDGRRLGRRPRGSRTLRTGPVYELGPDSWWRYLYWGASITTPTIIYRRRLLERAPSLDERYVDAADYEFYLRLFRQARLCRMKAPLVRFRYHEASKSASRLDVQLSEALQIRLGWARNPLERVVIRSIFAAQTLKYRIKPPWPDIEGAG